MKPLTHFHWISIDGKRPNIPENFIREEYKLTINHNNNVDILKELKDVSSENIDNNNNNKFNEKIDIQNPSYLNKPKVVAPVVHNISKELQIFLENFEQRFRKEIKLSKINPYQLYNVSKELQISKNIYLYIYNNKRSKRIRK
jgi:hypothetical protein